MRRRKRDPEVQATVFNAIHRVGTPVSYKAHPSADPVTTTTRSEAWVLGGHTAVVLIAAGAGCVALDALTPVDPAAPATTTPTTTVSSGA